MTRTEAISLITDKLAGLDDATVHTVAEIVDEIAGSVDAPVRELTARELALVEQSKADFAAGRTLSSEQYNAEMDDFMARMRAKYPTSA